MKSNFSIEPPSGLLKKIMTCIHREERILIIRKTIISSALLICSIAVFIPSLKMFLSDISNSGFLSFFSLIFSDFSSIANYWQSFGMILLETLPAISLAIFLAVALTLFQSIWSLGKEVKTIIKLRTQNV
jgi:hypothetical protein